MTEKRFTYGLRKETTQYEIQDSLHEFPFIEPFYYESHAKKVCNFLNELSDENGQLKKEIDFISKARLSSNELLQLVYSELLHEGSITFKRYTEIRDFCYEEFKNEVSE